MGDTYHSFTTVNNIMFDPSEMYPEGFHPTQMTKAGTSKAGLSDTLEPAVRI